MDTKRAAERWLVECEAEILRGEWTDPEAGRILPAEYCARWVKERELMARAREEYERHLRLHVFRQLGDRAIAAALDALIDAARGDAAVAVTG